VLYILYIYIQYIYLTTQFRCFFANATQGTAYCSTAHRRIKDWKMKLAVVSHLQAHSMLAALW